MRAVRRISILGALFEGHFVVDDELGAGRLNRIRIKAGRLALGILKSEAPSYPKE